MYKRLTTVTVIALLCGLSPSDPTNAEEQATGKPPVPPSGQIGEPDDSTKHRCGEYTPGRVLVGEFQTLKCDVQPPQKLDVVLFKGKFDGLTPRERCDHSGGHFHKHRNGQLRCNGIDY